MEYYSFSRKWTFGITFGKLDGHRTGSDEDPLLKKVWNTSFFNFFLTNFDKKTVESLLQGYEGEVTIPTSAYF